MRRSVVPMIRLDGGVHAKPAVCSMRSGDVVRLRQPAEILATLDDQGTLDGVPFMPEMLQYFGRRFTVSTRVEKICDTIAATGKIILDVEESCIRSSLTES